MRVNRRNFLGSAFVLPLACRDIAVSSNAPATASLQPAEFRDRLRGPIVSIPTPFTSEYAIDGDGLHRLIHGALEHDIGIFELTRGDSQYSYLSYEEIKFLTRSVVEAVGSRGMTIVGTGPWWTDRVIDFARFTESVGATALQVLPPTGIDDDSAFQHYLAISRNTRLPIVLHGNYSNALLKRLLDIEAIVALKEDVSPSYFIETLIHFGNRLNCFAGGSYEWYLLAQPYGARAYFDVFSTFAPRISQRFWKAVQANDISTEAAIVTKYDHPFLADHFSDAFWHATLEYFGVAKRYLRPPQHTFTDKEMESVQKFFDQAGVHPGEG